MDNNLKYSKQNIVLKYKKTSFDCFFFSFTQGQSGVRQGVWGSRNAR